MTDIRTGRRDQQPAVNGPAGRLVVWRGPAIACRRVVRA